MNNKIIVTLLAISTAVISLTGCSPLKAEMQEAMKNNQEIKLSVSGNINKDVNKLTWIELDQLETYSNIRDTWDDELQVIKFDNNSKNGMLFVDLNGNWAGNNTMYNAFQNKEFVKNYWKDNKVKSKFAQVAMNNFSDLNSESLGIYGSVNAYFNILPTNKDETSGLMNYLSRSLVLSAIYRGDTPVTFLEENAEFKEAVGNSVYNIYAQEVADISYLKYTNGGLNYDTYNSPCTRGEAIYALVQRYFKSDYDNVDIKNITFSDCKNAGNIKKKIGATSESHAVESYELEYCLQNKEDGCPEDIFKALVVAKNKGLLNSSETRWSDPIRGGELINFMIQSYIANQTDENYIVNAKKGSNEGYSLYVAEQEIDTEQHTTTGIDGVDITQVRDVTDLDDLLHIYGDEIDMTDEELAEAYDSASKFHFEPVDKWMEVAFCNNLNVRTGPSTDFRILRTVPCGTRVHIVARCVENGWYRIIANEKIVYQCGVYFQDFEGADEMLMRTGDNANDISKLTKKNKDKTSDNDTETNNESDVSDEALDETNKEVKDTSEESDTVNNSGSNLDNEDNIKETDSTFESSENSSDKESNNK